MEREIIMKNFKKKWDWYLYPIASSALIFFWMLGIPLLAGLIILVAQVRKSKKMYDKYSLYDELEEDGIPKQDMSDTWDELTKKKQDEYDKLTKNEQKKFEEITEEEQAKYDKLIQYKIDEYNKIVDKYNKLAEKYEEGKTTLEGMYSTIDESLLDIVVSSYNFSEYERLTSEECKDKLSVIKLKEQELIKSTSAFKIDRYVPKNTINISSRQIVRCFNSECDNIILNLSQRNIDTSRKKIVKSFETLNKSFEIFGVQMIHSLLEIKLEQLNLVYSYEIKRVQEKEEQKAIREQMIEEEKLRREIEKEKQKLEKEEMQFKGEVNKLMSYMQKTNSEVEKELYMDKIRELEYKLILLEKDKDNVMEREQNTRAGFVYIISNIGSFCEDIYKIGMTRRLEPMDRVKELSSASVPFNFDVHAMIFSEDAPALESTLHKTFKDYEVNKINPRKEFFKVNLKEIEKVVKENHNATVNFTMVAEAYEYRQSLQARKPA